MRYFKKIYPQNKVTLSSGKSFVFPATASGVGLLALDETKHKDLIRDFELLIAKQRGGISEITAYEYENEKKKSPPGQSPHQESFSVTQVVQMKRAADRASAEAADKERTKRQLTPVVPRGFTRPGMKFAGATQNPVPGQMQPGQWRPGVADR